MAAFDQRKPMPTDPIRGSVNDFFALAGLPTIEAAIGTPDDVIHIAGLPTFKDAWPTPLDMYSALVRDIRGGAAPFTSMPGFNMEGLPSIPAPPGIQMPGWLPRPGEGLQQASETGKAVKQAAGTVPGGGGNVSKMGQRYYNRYY